MGTKEENICWHAEQLFAQNGYAATSVRDIAGAAGVNVSMISYYFGSKEQLLERIFEVRMNEGIGFAQQILEEPSLNAGQKLLGVLEMYVDRVARLKQFYRVVQTEQVVNTSPRIQEFLRRSRLNFLEMLEKLLEEGKSTGLFVTEMPVTLLHATLVGTVFYAQLSRPIYQEYAGQEIINDENYWNGLKSHLLDVAQKLTGYEDK